jgi:hypothetical protein
MMTEKIIKMPKEWLPQSMVDLFLLDRLFRRFFREAMTCMFAFAASMWYETRS